MTDDLVKRLRDAADRAKREYPEVFRVSEEITYEAADRIEKLEAALRDVMEMAEVHEIPFRDRVMYVSDIARKAQERTGD